MPRDDKVLCMHCQQYISRSRERSHRIKQHAPLLSPGPPLPSKLRRVFDIEPDLAPVVGEYAAGVLEPEANTSGEQTLNGTPSVIILAI
jgi:hypothetical protein